MHIEQSNSTFIHFKFNFCENNAHLCIYFQLHTFLHLFFSQAGKQYHLWFNICLFQSTSVSTVQTAVYPGSDNSMCKLTLINRGHIFWDFHHCVPIYDFEDWLFEWLKICTGHTCRILSTIYLHMLFQIRCFKCWKIALIIFVGLYSNVYHYMNSQIGCLSGCKFALVTFVGFSSTVYLHPSGLWAGLDPKHLPQELWHGFSASWESSICERKLHYPGNRTQNLLLSGEIS